ncbi:MAG TPA: lipid-A-disaccharide synthase N-terminal domain-containing protein [Chthoniobacterales bacterium]|jgi:lipid-A-disaccharide synthase-like uncharacterized protein
MCVSWKWLAAVAVVISLAACEQRSSELDHIGRPVDGTSYSDSANSIKAGLPGARDEVRLVRLPDGSVGYLVQRLGAGTDRLLTAGEFSELVYSARNGRGWLARLLNITSPTGIAWVMIGILGQLIFTGRMLVQWVASEKSRRSVVPVAFWWMSLGGAVMLVIYFVWRRDIVGVVGQGTGLFIYARNLMLIRKSRGS